MASRWARRRHGDCPQPGTGGDVCRGGISGAVLAEALLEVELVKTEARRRPASRLRAHPCGARRGGGRKGGRKERTRPARAANPFPIAISKITSDSSTGARRAAQPPPLPAPPCPTAGVPLPGRSRSRTGVERSGNSAHGWEHTKCHHNSTPPSVCRCRPPVPLQGTVPGAGWGEPLCHRPGGVPAPPAQHWALGWMGFEITPFCHA